MQVDMRRDIHDLKASNARILGMIGEMVKAHASVDDRFNELESRIERLEDRLNHSTFARKPLTVELFRRELAPLAALSPHPRRTKRFLRCRKNKGQW